MAGSLVYLYLIATQVWYHQEPYKWHGITMGLNICKFNPPLGYCESVNDG